MLTRLAPLGLVPILLLALSCGGSDEDAPPTPSPTQGGTVTYVALGDSTGFGVGALPGEGGYPPRLARRLRDAGRSVDLVNLSIPGATASDLARVELPAIAPATQALITVCIGANDANDDRSPAAFAADLDAILARAVRVGLVVACNVPDISLTPRYGGDPAIAARVVLLNAEVARVAASRGVPVADVYGLTRDRLATEPGLFSIDGFHPSAAGYELWADAMLPTVQAALGP